MSLLFAGILFIASITPSGVLAQSPYDPWDEPLNISRSGYAMHPAFVMDSDGVGHVVWQDELENFVHAKFDGDTWSAPETTNLNNLFNLPITAILTGPTEVDVYNGPNPLFIASPGGKIFAFWISIQGVLFASKVNNPNFKELKAWDSRRQIMTEVAAFAATVDAGGELHVAYLRMFDEPEKPAGIYYTHSINNGISWDKPKLLYASTYLRALGNGEANLSIDTARTDETLRVYVAWDNRPRKQVFLAQSADGGANWEQPTVVAGPAPGSGLAGPFKIDVVTNQDDVMLAWQNGLPGGACSQIYQFSSDAGATWNDPQSMIDDLLGCAESSQFVRGLANGPEAPLYFLAHTKSQAFLSAWNGLKWSEPQAQPILSKFEEPEIYTDVIYGCHQAALLGERLYVVGCDQGDGGDIWVTSRDLGSDPFSLKPPIWSPLLPVTNENRKMEDVELLSTDDGLIHAFYSQHQDSSIYYTNWDGELWSRITAVLTLPDGETGWPAIASGPGNELFLVAPNNRGTLYFSRALSGGAALESNWSTPTRLEIAQDGEIGSVDIAWDAAGTVYVAYSVPVNDERGIYLVSSKDQGTTWSEPLRIFDAAAAGFNFVGAPSLLISADGFLHIIWNVQSIQGDGVPQPLSLYYTRSEDGGHSFNGAELVVEEPVAWREIVTDGKGNLHLLWQPQNTLTTVWDQVSLDGGHTWQYPQGLPDEGRISAVTEDPSGRLHLVDVAPGALAVGHWLWDGSHWQSEAPLFRPLYAQQKSPVELLAAAVNKQGKMMVIFAEQTGEGDAAEMTLLYSTRTLKLPPKPTAIKKVPTQTLLPPTLTPVAPTAELTATTIDSQAVNSQGQTDRNETTNGISPVTMALLPVALLLLSVLVFVIRRATRSENR